MREYQITNLNSAAFSEDRARLELHFETTEGPIKLVAPFSYLDGLSSCLQEVEYQASILTPGAPRPGEVAKYSTRILSSTPVLQPARLDDGRSVVLLTVQAENLVRHYALTREQVLELEQQIPSALVGVESPKAN